MNKIDVPVYDDEKANEYVKEFVEKYNNQTETQQKIKDKVCFNICGHTINSQSQSKKQIQIKITNLEDFCGLKVNLIKDYLNEFENVNLTSHFNSIFYEASKLKIPIDLLNDIFNKFAEHCNLSNDDFKSESVWDKSISKFLYPNNNFAYLCAIIYRTLYDLYGEDACKPENFKTNMEQLFTDKRIPGLRKLIAKLINFERFCDCCNNLDKIGFPWDWKFIYDLARPDYLLDSLASFQRAMKTANLNLLELVKHHIEDKSDLKTKDKKFKRYKRKTEKRKILLWKNLILILLIALSALASLLFGLNIKFLFIAVITNPLSIIITVVAIALFFGLTYYANKVKAIRLKKLCCGKESDGKSFFNIYKNIDNEIPEQSENNNLLSISIKLNP